MPSGFPFSRIATHVPSSLSGILFSTSGVLSAISTTGSGNAVLATSPTLLTPTIASLIGNKIYPASDGTTAIQFNKADGTTNVVTIDTTNSALTVNGNILTSASGSYIKVGSTNKLYFKGDFGGATEAPAGVYGGSNQGGFSILAGAETPSTSKLGGYYYASDRWLSAWEISNVTSGYGNLLLMKSGGNVGIGCTPATTLDVDGSVYAAYNVGDQVFFGTTTASSIYKFQFYVPNSDFAKLSLFHARTGSTAGIGSPMTFKLSTPSNMTDGFGPGFLYAIQDDAGVENFIARTAAIRYGADNRGAFQIDLFNYGVITTVATFLPTGFVGIGTTSPDARLEVESTAEQLRLSYDSTYYTKFTVDLAAGLTFTPSVNSTTAFNFTTAGGTSLFRIDTTNQRIGIAANPAVQFHIRGSEPTARYEIYRSGGGVAADFFQLYATNYTSGLSTCFGAIGFYGNLNTDPTPPSVGYLYFGADSDTRYTKNALRIYPSQVVMIPEYLGVGTSSVNAKVEILSTATQLRLSYSASYYTNFATSNAGNLTISPSGGTTNISGILSASGKIQGTYLNVSSTTTPGSPASGDVYFNGTHFYGYNGSSWLQLDNAA